MRVVDRIRVQYPPMIRILNNLLRPPFPLRICIRIHHMPPFPMGNLNLRLQDSINPTSHTIHQIIRIHMVADSVINNILNRLTDTMRMTPYRRK